MLLHRVQIVAIEILIMLRTCGLDLLLQVWLQRPFTTERCSGRCAPSVISSLAAPSARMYICVKSVSHVCINGQLPHCCLLSPRMEHMTFDASPQMNPLQTSNYSEEDLVGRMKKCLATKFQHKCWSDHDSDPLKTFHLRLAIMCHPKRLGLTVLQRYAWLVCVHWLRTD